MMHEMHESVKANPDPTAAATELNLKLPLFLAQMIFAQARAEMFML